MEIKLVEKKSCNACLNLYQKLFNNAMDEEWANTCVGVPNRKPIIGTIMLDTLFFSLVLFSSFYGT